MSIAPSQRSSSPPSLQPPVLFLPPLSRARRQTRNIDRGGNQLPNRPPSPHEPRGDRGRSANGLMGSNEIVVEEVKPHSGLQVERLLAKRVRQPRYSPL